MSKLKSIVWGIAYHGKIILHGFAKVVYSTGVAGLIGLAVYGFAAIPSEGGYVAVCEFIASVVTMVLALTFMYAIGGSKKKKGRFSSYE